MQRLFAVALVALALPVATARADWWSDAGSSSAASRTPPRWSGSRGTTRRLIARSSRGRPPPGGSCPARAGATSPPCCTTSGASGRPTSRLARSRCSGCSTRTRAISAAARCRADGADILDADGVVYRAFAGHGLQFHPLANFARLNRLLADGERPRCGLPRGRADLTGRSPEGSADVGVLLPLRRRLPAVDVRNGAGGRGAGLRRGRRTTTSRARRTSRFRATSSRSRAAPGSGCTASATCPC